MALQSGKFGIQSPGMVAPLEQNIMREITIVTTPQKQCHKYTYPLKEALESRTDGLRLFRPKSLRDSYADPYHFAPVDKLKGFFHEHVRAFKCSHHNSIIPLFMLLDGGTSLRLYS